MPEFSFQYAILLVALYFVLLLLVIAFVLRRHQGVRSCFPILVVLGLVIVVVYLLDPEKIYECRSTIPDQIRVAGHVTDSSNSPLNNHLVILYKGNEEIARDVTRFGRLQVDKQDQERDGYFELAAVNELQLNRCSMALDFKQDRYGNGLLGMANGTTYLWHNFEGIAAGTFQTLNHEEPKKTYTLVVLPSSLDHFPKELSFYSTYLDQNGKVAINAPIKTYMLSGNSIVENVTGFSIHASRLSTPPPDLSLPVLREVRDAWVVNGSTSEAPALSPIDPPIIDWDNCQGLLRSNATVPVSLIYFHEVQFQRGDYLNFDLAIAASKAAASLGFMQGQMATITEPVSVNAPAGIHRKYKVFWQDVWRTGSMSVDFGQNTAPVPFRARIGMAVNVQSIDVDCP